MENFNFDLSTISDLVIKYGLKLLLAVVTLIVGLWIIKLIMGTVRRNMEKRNVEASLRQFLHSIFSILLKIMLIISVISMVGVEMTSFVAILAAAGLAEAGCEWTHRGLLARENPGQGPRSAGR